MYKDFLFSTSSSTLIISFPVDNSHSNRYEVTFHYVFDFLSGDAEHLFMSLLVNSMYSLGRKVICPFFIWLLVFCCCMSSVFILDINPL